MTLRFLLASTMLLACLLACKTSRVLTRVPVAGEQVILLLDSAQAAQAVLIDHQEGFFERIRPLDMSLQLRRSLDARSSREQVLADYRAFLQTDMRSFSSEEARFLSEQIQIAYAQCKVLGMPDIFPDTLELLKTEGRHYGPSVYYTREKRIVFPRNELEAADPGSMLPVVYHELFHVFSRNNPEKRAALYRLIGFEPLSESPSYPEELDARVLLNPDGTDDRWAIRLNGTLYLPLIASRFPNFIPGRPQFFNYLEFGLYPLRGTEAEGYEVDPAGGSPSPQLMSAYFDRIGRNTQYIIHPDEILADNFMLLMMAESDPGKASKLDAQGQALLAEIRTILTAP